MMISHNGIKRLFIFLFLLSVGCTYTLTGVDNRHISTYKEKEQGYERVFINDKLSDDYDGIIVQYFPCNDNYLQASDDALLSYLDRKSCFLYRTIPNQVSRYLRERNTFKTIVVTDEIDSVDPRQLILKARLDRILLQNREDKISPHSDMVDVTYEIEGELADAITGRLIAKFKHLRTLPLQKRMLKEGIIAGGNIVAEDIARFIMRIY
ncbi:MAG: hypothetical protein GXO97_07320 [Nitrospirae bacterium]|nr:hypothetical protein [Nitrospirota bacterium]